MDTVVGIAGLLCVALALGHATLGIVWVLPGLREDDLPKTPFGPKAMTDAMIRATWHIITVFVLGLAGLLMTLAWADADPSTVVLRWVGAMWLGAAAVASWSAIRRVRKLRQLVRLPVPVLFVVVAVLCWWAST
ncbi:MAG TPA: hypothetical protein VIG64_14805 [Actinomycetota bacterium]|jgi:hypothetical protein